MVITLLHPSSRFHFLTRFVVSSENEDHLSDAQKVLHDHILGGALFRDGIAGEIAADDAELDGPPTNGAPNRQAQLSEEDPAGILNQLALMGVTRATPGNSSTITKGKAVVSPEKRKREESTHVQNSPNKRPKIGDRDQRSKVLEKQYVKGLSRPSKFAKGARKIPLITLGDEKDAFAVPDSPVKEIAISSLAVSADPVTSKPKRGRPKKAPIAVLNSGVPKSRGKVVSPSKPRRSRKAPATVSNSRVPKGQETVSASNKSYPTPKQLLVQTHPTTSPSSPLEAATSDMEGSGNTAVGGFRVESNGETIIKDSQVDLATNSRIPKGRHDVRSRLNSGEEAGGEEKDDDADDADGGDDTDGDDANGDECDSDSQSHNSLDKEEGNHRNVIDARDHHINDHVVEVEENGDNQSERNSDSGDEKTRSGGEDSFDRIELFGQSTAWRTAYSAAENVSGMEGEEKLKNTSKLKSRIIRELVGQVVRAGRLYRKIMSKEESAETLQAQLLSCFEEIEDKIQHLKENRLKEAERKHAIEEIYISAIPALVFLLELAIRCREEQYRIPSEIRVLKEIIRLQEVTELLCQKASNWIVRPSTKYAIINPTRQKISPSLRDMMKAFQKELATREDAIKESKNHAAMVRGHRRQEEKRRQEKERLAEQIEQKRIRLHEQLTQNQKAILRERRQLSYQRSTQDLDGEDPLGSSRIVSTRNDIDNTASPSRTTTPPPTIIPPTTNTWTSEQDDELLRQLLKLRHLPGNDSTPRKLLNPLPRTNTHPSRRP